MSKLVVKKKYRVGLSSSNLFGKIEKSLFQDETLKGCSEWRIAESGVDKARIYKIEHLWYYIMWKCKGPQKPSIKELRKHEKQYYADILKLHDEVLLQFRNDLPYELYVLIEEADELGCVCVIRSVDRFST